MRLVLLATISFIVQLTEPVFTAFGHGFSWRDLILIAGGLFLVWKATKEIHHTVDPEDHKDTLVGQAVQLSLGARDLPDPAARPRLLDRFHHHRRRHDRRDRHHVHRRHRRGDA